MTLKDYFESIPDLRKELIEKIIEKTDTSESIVYRYISGGVNPPMIKKRIIAEIIGLPLENLFPEKLQEA